MSIFFADINLFLHGGKYFLRNLCYQSLKEFSSVHLRMKPGVILIAFPLI